MKSPKAVSGLFLMLVSFLQAAVPRTNAEVLASETQTNAPEAFVNRIESAPASESTRRLSAFEQFKAFVANPPPIEEVRFSYTGPPTHQMDERGQWHREPASREYFWARYQPQSILSIRMLRAVQLKSSPFSSFAEIPECRAVFQCDDELWAFRTPGRAMTFWKGRPAPPIDTSNPVLLSYEFETTPMFALLSMGPHFVRPGSICWSGNTFATEARLNNDRFSVSGEIFPDSLGRARKMAMHYKSATVDGSYEVAHTYGTNTDLPDYLPSHLRSVVLQGPKTDPDKEITVFSLKLASRPLSAEMFRPAVWSSGAAISRFVYTNKSLFIWSQDGAMQPVRFRERARIAAPSWVLVHASWYYYAACTLLSAGFLIFNRRMRCVK